MLQRALVNEKRIVVFYQFGCQYSLSIFSKVYAAFIVAILKSIKNGKSVKPVIRIVSHFFI